MPDMDDLATADAETRSPWPRRLAISGMVLAVLFLGTGGWFWTTRPSEGPSIGGPFSLVNGDGKVVTDRDFRGRYMLVYFGYTFCPDVCPTTLNEVAQAMDTLGAQADGFSRSSSRSIQGATRRRW